MIWAALLAAITLLGTASPSSAQEGTWPIEEVGAGTKPELSVDSRGTIHIAFMTELFDGEVLHASRAGEGWQVTSLATGYFYGPLDLAIDSRDRPHIAYHDHSFEDLAYAHFDGTAWQVENIPHIGHDGWDSSIALGPEDEVYLAGIDPIQFDSQDGVEWASRSGDGWLVESVGSGAIPYEFGTDMAIDHQGQAHLVFHDGGERFDSGNADLVYAVRRNGRWSTTIADESGDVGKFASIELDREGNPHVAYFEWTETTVAEDVGFIKYARFDGSAWIVERVAPIDDMSIGFLGARRTVTLVLDEEGSAPSGLLQSLRGRLRQ